MRHDLYRDDRERVLHQHVIHAIATEIGLPDGTVGPLYETELEKLKASARIMEYLPLLIRRKVTETLKLPRRGADVGPGTRYP
ncbi:MAG: DUF3562 domain-containing protein [Acidiferrobacterales bacterium]